MSFRDTSSFNNTSQINSILKEAFVIVGRSSRPILGQKH